MNIEQAPPRAAGILLVDDDLAAVHALASALEGLGDIRFATSGAEALQLMRSWLPDLILLDADMPGIDGFEACRTLKSDPAFCDIPVIFVTSHEGQDFEELSFACGAADFVSKPIRPGIVWARARAQIGFKLASDKLRAVSRTDALTGLANRRAFDEALNTEWRRARRHGLPLSLLMIDVDYFKQFNDRYGHQAGDECLRSLSLLFRSMLKRPADFGARYGGEEFALLLPATDRRGAGLVAHRLVEGTRQLAIPHEDSHCDGVVTVSIGVSSYDTDSSTWMVGGGITQSGAADPVTYGDLVAAADQALYVAKGAGRARWHEVAIEKAMEERLASQPLR